MTKIKLDQFEILFSGHISKQDSYCQRQKGSFSYPEIAPRQKLHMLLRSLVFHRWNLCEKETDLRARERQRERERNRCESDKLFK